MNKANKSFFLSFAEKIVTIFFVIEEFVEVGIWEEAVRPGLAGTDGPIQRAAEGPAWERGGDGRGRCERGIYILLAARKHQQKRRKVNSDK